MEQHVKERIRKQYGNLTASQKIISKLAIEKPSLLAIHTAKKIAELTNTSEATVIRFCYALGYSGYTELQDEIKKSLLVGEQKKGPFQKYRDTEDTLSRDNYAHQVIETDIAYLQQSLQQIDYGLLQQAIDQIIRANRIVVVGFRWCHIPAKWLFSSLNAIKGTRICIPEQWIMPIISSQRESRNGLSSQFPFLATRAKQWQWSILQKSWEPKSWRSQKESCLPSVRQPTCF